jgi:hypothetical protein
MPYAKTCIYSNTAIVYMPHIKNSNKQLNSMLIFIIITNLILTLLL